MGAGVDPGGGCRRSGGDVDPAGFAGCPNGVRVVDAGAPPGRRGRPDPVVEGLPGGDGRHREAGWRGAPELRPDVRAETARTVVAEQRGDFLFVALATDTGATAQCFLSADDPGRVYGTTGGAPTASTPPPVVLAADRIEAEGGGLASGPEGSYAFAQGRVGDDVLAVTLRVDGATIRATVGDGSFAAWWPAPAASGPSPSPIIAYDLTLANGVVVKDADPGLVQDKAPGPREIGRIEAGGGATDRGMVQTLAGHAGSDVVAVTVWRGDTSVSVPVTDGVFTATWPSEVADAPAPTYDLTLRDGTILRGQKPVSGAGS